MRNEVSHYLLFVLHPSLYTLYILALIMKIATVHFKTLSFLRVDSADYRDA